jgi:hypothetical protein
MRRESSFENKKRHQVNDIWIKCNIIINTMRGTSISGESNDSSLCENIFDFVMKHIIKLVCFSTVRLDYSNSKQTFIQNTLSFKT